MNNLARQPHYLANVLLNLVSECIHSLFITVTKPVHFLHFYLVSSTKCHITIHMKLLGGLSICPYNFSNASFCQLKLHVSVVGEW